MSAREIQAGKAAVSVSLNDKDIRAKLDKLNGRMKTFSLTVAKIGGAFAAAGAGMLAPIVTSATHFMSLGDQIHKASIRMGVSTEALSTLTYVAGQSGSGIEDLEGAFKKLNQTVGQAKDGNKQAQETLQSLGLTLDDIRDKTPEQQFKMIADRIAGVEDPARRADMAIRAFEEGGLKLLPMLTAGSEGIEAMQQSAHELGQELSGPQADAAAAATDALDNLRKAISGMMLQIGAVVAGPLTEMVNWVVEIAKVVVKWTQENRLLTQVLAIVGGGVLSLGTMLVGLAAAIRSVAYATQLLTMNLIHIKALRVLTGSTITGAISALKKVGAVLMFLGSIKVGAIVAGIAGIGYALVRFTNVGKKTWEWIKGVFRPVAEWFREWWDYFNGSPTADPMGDMASSLAESKKMMEELRKETESLADAQAAAARAAKIARGGYGEGVDEDTFEAEIKAILDRIKLENAAGEAKERWQAHLAREAKIQAHKDAEYSKNQVDMLMARYDIEQEILATKKKQAQQEAYDKEKQALLDRLKLETSVGEERERFAAQLQREERIAALEAESFTSHQITDLMKIYDLEQEILKQKEAAAKAEEAAAAKREKQVAAAKENQKIEDEIYRMKYGDRAADRREHLRNLKETRMQMERDGLSEDDIDKRLGLLDERFRLSIKGSAANARPEVQQARVQGTFSASAAVRMGLGGSSAGPEVQIMRNTGRAADTLQNIHQIVRQRKGLRFR